jgi:periplasmic mercuric ion binding protein
MKTKTLKISVIALFTAIVTLGISSCSGRQQNQDQGSHPAHGQSHDVEVSDVRMAEFNVNGNCSMCKRRIEEAARSVGGVTSAEWDVNARMVEITMRPGTDVHDVHQAIAKAGHDTEMHKATDEAYDNLHACCKYERD